MRVSAPLIGLALCALAAPVAQAQSQNSGWIFHAGAGSDNRARDASRSDGKAFVWGRGLWNNAERTVYVGPAIETLDLGGAHLGTGILLGVKPSFGGFNWDLQASYKTLIDADSGFDDGTYEVKVDAYRNLGPVRTRVRGEFSPDGLGATEEWSWISVQGAYPLTRKLTASAEIGYRDQENSIDYTGYNAGMSYALTPQLAVDVRWHGTDANIPGEQHRDRVVANFTYGF